MFIEKLQIRNVRPWPGSNVRFLYLFYKHAMPLASFLFLQPGNSKICIFWFVLPVE